MIQQEINTSGITILLIDENAGKSLRISSCGFIVQKGEIVGQGQIASLKESKMARKA